MRLKNSCPIRVIIGEIYVFAFLEYFLNHFDISSISVSVEAILKVNRSSSSFEVVSV
jgi:hypothetical protein